MPADDAHICVLELVHSFCEQRNLPTVVTDLIAGYLDERDLFTISSLSRKLNEQANSLIYRNVVLDLTQAACSGRKAALLLRTLLTSRTSASNIRNLALTGDPLVQWRNEIPRYKENIEGYFRGQRPPEVLFDLSTFTPKEIELHRTIPGSLPRTMHSSKEQISLPTLCLDIIRLSTNLQDLQISSDYFRYPDFRDNLRGMVELGGFQHLQSCSLCLDVVHGEHRHIEAVRDWDNELLTPFLANDIKSIAAVMTLKPEAVSQLRISSITRLVLHHCQIQDSDLTLLLAATPRLSYLEYHTSVDYAWFTSSRWEEMGTRPSLGLECLFDALHHVSDTLRELVASQKFREDCRHFQPTYVTGYEPPFRQRNEMSKLKHLHTLSIPYASLLGWICREGHSWEWHKILPASLRQITLTDDLHENLLSDPWTDESLMPVISGLVGWLATHRQGDQPSKFGLRLLQSSTDFNEPVRQKLSMLCEEHGLLCSIKKIEKDHKEPDDHFPRGPRGPRGGLRRGRGGILPLG